MKKAKDARQEMIDRVAEAIKNKTRERYGWVDNVEHIEIATHLVDQGIRSKEGFEIGKTRSTDFNKRTGGIQFGWVILPINYKQE